MNHDSGDQDLLWLEKELGQLTSPEDDGDGPLENGTRRKVRILGWGMALSYAVAVVVLLIRLPVNATAELVAAGDARFRLMIAVAHLPLTAIFLGLCLTRFGLTEHDELPRSRVAQSAWRQILVGLKFLSAAWFALYAWMALMWSGADFLGPWRGGPRGLVVADLLNTVGSLAFFYLYLVLDKPSVPAADDPQRDRSFRRALAFTAVLCGAVGLLALFGRLGHFQMAEIGPLCGSFVAAISMMYFFGQFDYRYMKVKRWMIAPLYLYVAIQMAWHEIAASASQGWYPDALLLAALLLKVYLFGMLIVWIRNKTLQKYLDFAGL